MSSERSAPPTTRLAALRIAAGILAAEGVAAAAFGVFEATQINAARLVVGLGAAVLLFGYGVLLVLLGRGLLQTRRWSRGPVTATQLIQLPLAWSFHEGGTWPVTALLGLASIIVLICIFTPASTAALVGDNPVPIGGGQSLRPGDPDPTDRTGRNDPEGPPDPEGRRSGPLRPRGR